MDIFLLRLGNVKDISSHQMWGTGYFPTITLQNIMLCREFSNFHKKHKPGDHNMHSLASLVGLFVLSWNGLQNYPDSKKSKLLSKQKTKSHNFLLCPDTCSLTLMSLCTVHTVCATQFPLPFMIIKSIRYAHFDRPKKLDRIAAGNWSRNLQW